MRYRLKPFPELEGDQAAASDPNVHAALSASAGTGKTQVLTARVLRLLLRGVRPEHILCLTFTKAGAAEMANRINARLASWVRMRDQDLRSDLLASAKPMIRRHCSARGGCSRKSSKRPAACASRPSTASPRRCSPPSRPRRGSCPGFQPLEGRAEQELARAHARRLCSPMPKRRRRGADRRRPVPQPAARREQARSPI